MPDDNPQANQPTGEADPTLDFLGQLGGELPQDSGFEDEVPEPESDWRDPR